MTDTTTRLRGDVKRFTLYLSSALHKRLRIAAVEADTSASKLAESLIAEGLDRNERTPAELRPL